LIASSNSSARITSASAATGLEDVSKTPSLTARLLQRGYSERDVKKILGGDFLRVMRQVIGR
jgi:membrane dipeptidase